MASAANELGGWRRAEKVQSGTWGPEREVNVLVRETVRERVREASVVVAEPTCRPNEKNGMERPSAFRVNDY